MYHSIFTMLDAEDEIDSLKEYLKGSRKNFVRATLYWFAFAGIIAVMFAVFLIVLYADAAS